MATTETQKPKERELPQILPPKKKVETVLQKPEPSLPEHLDESANSSTRPYDSATDVPQKEGGEESKESGSVSAEAPMSSSAADAASVSDLQRKIRRAERFGTAVQLSEEEKRNSRAERFGTGSTLHGSDESKKLEDQKRKARAERFGLPAQSVADEEAKKKARLARFTPAVKTDSLEEDKKKARAIRFSQSPSDASSPVNGKVNSELKTAIVGKPHGGT